MKVNLVYNRIPHHASRSGYDQVARYIADHCMVERIISHVPKLIPWNAWRWIAESSADWIGARTGVRWYEAWALTLEVATAARLVRGQREIYHILYGENNYRYLGCIRRLAHRKGSRIMCTYHQPPEVFETVVRPKRILGRLDGIVAVASNQAEYFGALVGREKVFVVPHGVDTDFYRPRIGGGKTGRACLVVGKWLRDFEMLKAVVRRVEAGDAAVKFTIISPDDVRPQFEGLGNVVVRSGVSDTELLDAYQCADMLVLPLTDCTANNSLLEGLACGLPIVTTDVGGVRDYVDAACGFIVESGNVEAMSEAVLELTGSERLRGEMGRESRLRARRYDWGQIAESLVGVYRALLS